MRVYNGIMIDEHTVSVNVCPVFAKIDFFHCSLNGLEETVHSIHPAPYLSNFNVITPWTLWLCLEANHGV